MLMVDERQLLFNLTPEPEFSNVKTNNFLSFCMKCKKRASSDRSIRSTHNDTLFAYRIEAALP